MFPALLALALSTPADPCPPGNLLAGRRPWAWQDVRGRVELATDGVRAPEGAVWDAPLAIVLDTGAAALTWDLGASYPLAAVWIQADANDAYTVWGSTDGADFRALGRVEPVPGHGLRARSLATGGAPVRYLRFGEGEGDGYYSVAEIQAFCRLPTPYPPAMAVGDARPAPAPRTIYDYWNDATSARWELALAGLGLALLSWRTRRRALRDGLLAALGAIAALTYVNFGFFHFGNFIHDHEWTHYYLGAKYQAELSYDGLYECLATADAEDGLRRRVELRKITNLRTNALERTDDVLAHPERCTSRFTGDRWRAFKRDVAYFRARQSPRRWDDVQIDHGYNATPVWTVAGQALASLAPAGDAQLWALAMLDPLCLLATIAVVWWAFGWRVLCVTLLVFATSFPSRFYWTGGAFLRWDWLFHLVASICCLRKGRHALAGAALAYAALLRVFPAVVFAGARARGRVAARARPPDGRRLAPLLRGRGRRGRAARVDQPRHHRRRRGLAGVRAQHGQARRHAADQRHGPLVRAVVAPARGRARAARRSPDRPVVALEAGARRGPARGAAGPGDPGPRGAGAARARGPLRGALGRGRAGRRADPVLRRVDLVLLRLRARRGAAARAPRRGGALAALDDRLHAARGLGAAARHVDLVRRAVHPDVGRGRGRVRGAALAVQRRAITASSSARVNGLGRNRAFSPSAMTAELAS